MIGKVSNRTFTLMMLGMIVGLFTLVVVVMRAPSRQDDKKKKISDNKPISEGQEVSGLTGDKPPGEGYVKVGGVWRPESDITPVPQPEYGAQTGLKNHAGQSPRIPLDQNPHVESVAEGLRNTDFPERLSTWQLPKPFDVEEYKRDPTQYAETVEPGRAFVTAAENVDAEPIKRLVQRYHRIVAGDSVSLSLRIEPGMPATFYTPNLGSFPNQLKSITVIANEEGVAETQYTATEGAQGYVDIVAASPVHTGLARFFVEVDVPSPTVSIE